MSWLGRDVIYSHQSAVLYYISHTYMSVELYLPQSGIIIFKSGVIKADIG